jgi:multidrug efflux pump subunit AcrB
MATNPVAANILMFFFLLGGLYWAGQIKQEVFPEFDLDEIVVRVAYPGAGPEEVAEGIILPVEEALSGLEDIRDINSSAVEGSGTIRVEARKGADLQQLALDIKNEVDRISSFPVDAEEPSVSVPLRRRSVITLVLYGELSRQVLRENGEMVRDRLLQDPIIAQVDLRGDRPLEVSIEIPAEILRSYDITLQEIAERIRRASLDLPGGSIRASGGQIQLRMKEKRDLGREFGSLPILTTGDGMPILLRDLAVIRDGFAETDQELTFNGRPAIGIEVYRVGDQGPMEIARAVRRHMADLQQTLPAGISVAAVDDRSEVYKQRLHLLLKNGYLGLILVFLLLGIFLEPRLAFWVTLGIPVSFLGSLLFLPMLDVSINMISLFAFIVSLGIVVDDTIIIGENVYRLRQEGKSALDSAVEGAREMAVPVTFSVLTNIITFMPLYFVPGVMGKIFRDIPLVVAVVFAISLVEALFVLPAHLGHQKPLRGRVAAMIADWQARVSAAIGSIIQRGFTPSLIFCLRYRYITVASGLALLMVTGAFIKSGRMGMTLFPRIESDKAYVSFALPVGVPLEETRAIRDRLLAAANRIIEKNGGERLVHGILSEISENSGWIKVYLTPPDVRPLATADFVRKWRQNAGPLAGLDTLQFKSNFGGPGSGATLTVELSHRDDVLLEQAARELATALASFATVSDIDNGFTRGKQQFDLQLLPSAHRLGLRTEDVGRQIRAAFYGREITRQLRGRNEVKIMVRLPESERSSVHSLERMMIRLPSGGEVPLTSIASINRGRAFTEIKRGNGRRIIRVTADVNPPSQADQVVAALKSGILPELKTRFPGLSSDFGGKQKDRKESMQALARGMGTALLLVYVLLAVVFRSYIQPAIIMTAIPFGVVGAVLGHLIMGYSLSLISFFGIVALSGVVVNDSLVLIDLANRKHREGQTGYAAVVNAAVSRFRPIILTTLTTFFGLMPMIFETSRQARFLIPMAISLGFGILFATAITLVLVPSLYLILQDLLAGDPAEQNKEAFMPDRDNKISAS